MKITIFYIKTENKQKNNYKFENYKINNYYILINLIVTF